jgi:hypothetical protein
MSNFRRLPPVLRVASILRLLLPLGATTPFNLLAQSSLSLSPHEGV